MTTIMITGADGYLGQRLVAEFLQQPDIHLILWLRADNTAEADEKRNKMIKMFPALTQKADLFFGNLSAEHPFDTVPQKNITHILHCAAVTRFNVDAAQADQINREGTRQVLTFARQCPALIHYGQISTVYASGLAQGTIAEAPLEPTLGFANHYERSKWEAEQLILGEFSDLPSSIYRIATVICDNISGQVSQYNVFHNSVRLLFNGLISLLPGHENTPLYFVTGDYCQKSIAQLLLNNETIGQICNLCYGSESAITLSEMVDVFFNQFSNDEMFVRRRILRPLLSTKAAFDTLSNALEQGLGSQMLRESLESIRPFADQMYLQKSIDHHKQYEWIEPMDIPNIHELIAKVTDDLIQTKWGRKPR